MFINTIYLSYFVQIHGFLLMFLLKQDYIFNISLQ